MSRKVLMNMNLVGRLIGCCLLIVNSCSARNLLLAPDCVGSYLLAFDAISLSLGQQIEPTSSGGSIAHLDGIDVEFDANGQWFKVYSTYVHPVEFPDRRGIKKAQIIAEENGKAAIIRFLNQDVQSERLVQEMESTAANTKMTKGTGDKDGTVKTAARTMVESVREFTRSYASGSIKGLTVVEAGYDEKKEEAWVKVGFSRTTIRTADQLRNDIQHDRGEATNGAATPGKNVINPEPSEVRTRTLPQF